MIICKSNTLIGYMTPFWDLSKILCRRNKILSKNYENTYILFYAKFFQTKTVGSYFRQKSFCPFSLKYGKYEAS